MADYDPPSPAILAESVPHLRAQSAAITLRIWHHLTDEEARALLFEPFRIDGRSLPLIEAILITASESDRPFALHIDAARIRAGQPSLGDAFAAALIDIFGDAFQERIVTAWRVVLDGLLDRIAARLERRRA